MTALAGTDRQAVRQTFFDLHEPPEQTRPLARNGHGPYRHIAHGGWNWLIKRPQWKSRLTTSLLSSPCRSLGPVARRGLLCPCGAVTRSQPLFRHTPSKPGLPTSGAFTARSLEECTLFLWATAPSAAASIFDHENELLASSVLRFFVGILIATPYYSCGRLTLLTGANSDGTARARSLTTYNRTWHTLGAPEAGFTTPKLRLAARLALRNWIVTIGIGSRVEWLGPFVVSVKPARHNRSTSAFISLSGARRRSPHQETASSSWAASVVSVAGITVDSSGGPILIRSSIEHLQGPYARLPRSATKRERHVLFLRRCVEAEALARYLLTAYLLDRRLWKHFRDRTRVSAFWALSGSALRSVWPSRLGFDLGVQFFRSSVSSASPRRSSRLGDCLGSRCSSAGLPHCGRLPAALATA